MRSALATLLLGVALPAAALASGPMTWGDFLGVTPRPGMPTTVSLGGGSTVDVLVNTGGTQEISAADLGATGADSTGLDYQHLIVFGIFDGGGFGTVPTTISYSNFHAGPNHVSGYLMVGAVNGRSSPIAVTSSVPGAVQTWTQAGSSFDINSNNSWPISWSADSGQFATDAPTGIDSDGIVIRMGSISQYTSVTISLEQYLDDGILFSIGEEVSATAGVSEQPEVRISTWGRIKALMR